MELLTSPPPPSLRVAVAEDHPRLRALLRAQLAAAPGVVVVGEAESGVEAVALARRLRPDVMVLDIELVGGLDGLGVAAALAGRGGRILAHSSHSDPVHVAALLRVGAAGYLSKEAPSGRIVAAVRAVAAGEGRWFEAPVAPEPVGALSPRGRAALGLLAAGATPATLPDPAALDEALAALGASSWYEALARAWALGLVGDRSADRGPGVGESHRPYEGGPSTGVNVPGQASSASAGSYGA